MKHEVSPVVVVIVLIVVAIALFFVWRFLFPPSTGTPVVPVSRISNPAEPIAGRQGPATNDAPASTPVSLPGR
jgi:hypothetical protein